QPARPPATRSTGVGAQTSPTTKTHITMAATTPTTVGTTATTADTTETVDTTAAPTIMARIRIRRDTRTTTTTETAVGCRIDGDSEDPWARFHEKVNRPAMGKARRVVPVAHPSRVGYGEAQ